MVERNKNSFLELKAREIKDEEERYMQELKEMAAADAAAGTNDSKSKVKSSSNKSNFCTFM